MAGSELLCQTLRGGFIENQHHGWWVVCDAEGKIQHSAGEINGHQFFLRSTAKPFQAFPVVQQGFYKHLTTEELAVCCASHTGSDQHQRLATSILNKAGLTPEALQCGCHPPIDAETRKQLYKKGEASSSLHHNCSGKHVGMLFYCQQAGLSIEDYLTPNHPLQQSIINGVKHYSGCDDFHWGIDGCSAPAIRLPMISGARLYAQLAADEAIQPLVKAMMEHPDVIGGNGRIDSELIKASNGKLLAKVGADGVFGISHLGKKQGLMLKLADGSEWARNKFIVHLLVQLGWLSLWQVENSGLNSFYSVTLNNNQGLVVGEFQAVFD